MRRNSKYPTELELEILKVVWEQGSASVRAVRDVLAERGRDLAHTSVMTMMGIMTDKGYLNRSRAGNSFVYQPRITHEWTAGRMLKDVVERAFDGSAASAMVHLIESGEVDERELAELRRLLDKKGGATK